MNSKLEILNDKNSVLLMIDYQPQMVFGVSDIDRQTLINNAVALAKSAKLFNVPTILTSVESESFSGYYAPQLLDVFPTQNIFERSSMDASMTRFVRLLINSALSFFIIFSYKIKLSIKEKISLQEDYFFQFQLVSHLKTVTTCYKKRSTK